MPTRSCRRTLGRALRILGAGVLLAACGGPSASTTPNVSQAPRLRYVALGDSFTIGTSVEAAERFPNQLAARVPQLELIANLGVNGFTTRDLIDVELPELSRLNPEFVTVLIGVNDIVQGVSQSTYKDNVIRIFGELRKYVEPDRIVVVTIPDYTVTPAGGDYGDPATQSKAIRDFNFIMTQLAAPNATVVDIYDLSLGAGSDRSLVADDGLHPSGAQYALWVERIAPVVEALLGEVAT